MNTNRIFPVLNWRLYLVAVSILSLMGSNFTYARAAGITYYVDNTALCSDSGTGTDPAAPFCTISKAASIAVAGDTVQVVAGTYAETVNGTNSGTVDQPITYSAAQGVTVSGNGQASSGGAFRISGKTYVVVNGFTIIGTADYGIYVSGSNHITLSNNHVSYSGSTASGSTRAGIYINSTTNSTITGNTSDHNSSHGILLTNGSNSNLVSNNAAFANAEVWQRNANGINLSGSTSNTILHNIAYANEDSGLMNNTGASGNIYVGNLTYGNGDHGIDNFKAPGNILVGNTVQGNYTAGINFEGTSGAGSGGATIANNILVDNGINPNSSQKINLRVDANSVLGTTIDYDIVYLSSAGTVEIQWNGTSYTTLAAFKAAVSDQEVHGLQVNPLFSAPAPIAQRPPAINVGDYHLTTGSPAIDSANADAPYEPLLDLEGNPRVDDPFTADSGVGARSYDDRGAYEFQPAIETTLPTVTTDGVANTTQTTATANGTITDLGLPNASQYGVVWDTAANPTIALTTKTAQGVPAGAGAFTSSITGLTANTLYHVRAYATNAAGTAYGDDVIFTTLVSAAPTATTDSVNEVTQTTATVNGTISDLGMPSATQYGVVWGTAINPTVALSTKTTQGVPAGTGPFTSSIAGLAANTLYHVRAYATNTAGTGYGQDVTFTTLHATYYVDNTNPVVCDDAGAGTSSTPFCSIGKAAGIAVAGDTVRVVAGTYGETVNGKNSGSAGAPITYSAAPGVTVTGNGSNTAGGGFRMSGKSYIVVDGFTIAGTADYGIYSFGSNNITITNNLVSDAGRPESGLTRAGIYLNGTTNSTISLNRSDHNSSHGILLTNGSDNNLVSNNITFANAQEYTRDASGIRLDGSDGNTILHNLSYANEDSGVTSYTGSSGNFYIGNLTYGNGDHGFDFNAAPGNTVIGNTVQGNVTAGINFEGSTTPGSGGATVANNVLVDNGLLQQVGGGTPTGMPGNLRFDAVSASGDSFDFNLFYLTGSGTQIQWNGTNYPMLAAFQAAGTGQETNGLQANPFLTAPAPIAQRPASAPFNVAVNVGDYHLMAGSPAIDSANSDAPYEPTVDREGNARVDDPATANTGVGARTYDDRGAYEFQPVAGATLPVVTTQEVTDIMQSSATGNGTIVDLGIPNPTQHGFVWSTLANPTVQDNKTMDGAVSATGAFTTNISGLSPATLYHVRAYAWNAAGAAYGEDVTFTTPHATYYVDNTNAACSDAGPGATAAQPFCTIGKAAGLAVAGDTVQVLAGTYAETVNGANSGSGGVPITYAAAAGVTVTGNAGNGFTISNKSYIVVDGFTVTGTTGYGLYVSGSNNITLSNDHVSYAGSPLSGSTRVGIYLTSTSNSTIDSNTSDHNSNHGILLTGGSNNNLVSNNITFANAQGWQRDASGIRLDGAGTTNNTILHNVSYANEDSGITNYTGASANIEIGNLLYGNGDHGIDDLNSPNNIIIGNTAQGNVTAGINFEGTAAPGSGGATVANNVLVDNGLRLQVGGGTTSGQPSNLRFDATSLVGDAFDYNLFYLSGTGTQIQWNGTNYSTLAAFQTAVPTQEVHGVQANPLFMAPAPIAQRPAAAPYNVAVNVGDYHLRVGSPAIDSANSNAQGEPSLDLDGNGRTDDPATANTGAGVRTYDDRGVYEFQPMIVSTDGVTNITQTTATGNGTISAVGLSNPTQHGFVWSTKRNPTTANSKTTDGPVSATGSFTSSMTGLSAGTLYHVRAYATNAAGTTYGADVSFTTLTSVAPTVTTQAVTNIAQTTATGNGNITSLGVPNPTQYGVVWGTALNPTISLSTKTTQGVPAGTGAFTSDITGLTSGTLYHVRAYATNTAGTAYGADVTFTTIAIPAAPSVTTLAVTNIAQTTATGNGNITSLGVPNPTQYGVVWDIAANPTIELSTKTAQGTPAGTGAFTSSITGLTAGTLYYVRAYATNTTGTGYGAEVTFTTLVTPVAPTVTTQAVTNIAQTTATGNGNITSLGVPNPTQYGVVWGTSANPTVSLSTKTTQGTPGGTGAFTSSITGLSPATQYHVRAYATNTAGTAYGADVTFTTLAAVMPSVTTLAVTSIARTSATGNGNITSLGVPNPTQYGVVWSTSANPTVALSTKTTQGAATNTGAFNSSITGLKRGTTYHVRAYVTNAAGTAYGVDITFTTSR